MRARSFNKFFVPMLQRMIFRGMNLMSEKPPIKLRLEGSYPVTKKEQFLNLYFDRELDLDDHLLLKRSLEDGDSNLKQELEEFRRVRNEVRAWVFDAMLDDDGSVKKLDLWSKIETKIDTQEETPIRSWSQLFSRINYRLLDAVSEVYESWSRPQLWAPAALALLLSFYVGTFWGASRSPSANEQKYQKLAQNDEKSFSSGWPAFTLNQKIASRREQPRLVALVSEPQLPGDIRAERSDSNLFPLEHEVRFNTESRFVGANTGDNLEQDSSLDQSADTWQLVKIGPAPGGLRAGNLDIDWIKSNRRVKILSPEDPTKTPVIWLTKNVD